MPVRTAAGPRAPSRVAALAAGFFAGCDPGGAALREDTTDAADSGACETAARYPDEDGDGYGTGAATTACDTGTGLAAETGDCDDDDPRVHPGAAHECRYPGTDLDCDGLATAGCTPDDADWVIHTLLYPSIRGDVDGDGLSDVLSANTGWDGYAAVMLGASVVAGAGADPWPDRYAHLLYIEWPGTEYAAGPVPWTIWAGDVDGDGRSDILVPSTAYSFNASDAGRVYLALAAQLGAESFDLGQSAMIVDGTAANQRAGYPQAALGDVDGDGLADIVIGVNPTDDPPSVVTAAAFFSGRTGGLAGSFRVDEADLLVALDATTYHVRALDGLGDLDGDGLDELGLATSHVEVSSPAYFLSVAGARGASVVSLDDADWRMEPMSATAGSGRNVGGGGDIDGDGAGDVVVALSSEPGTVVVLGGSQFASGRGELAPEVSVVEGADDYYIGETAEIAGDVNGNGLDDLFVSSWPDDYLGAAYLLDGSLLATGGVVSITSAEVWWKQQEAEEYRDLGEQSATGGDIDGDGRPDLVLGSWNAQGVILGW